MDIRKMLEERELKILSPYAAKSVYSKGREREEEKCDIRTDFQRDRDRIIHSKAFRRLKHKTQVFLSPEGDHYRTRLTHTLEVSQIARTISRALSLNEDLTEAISLGHDLGHTSFGHMGEKVLNSICPYGFRHNVHSLRVVDLLERKGGLNLTYEVRDGILCHTGSKKASTLEGQVVAISDKIAYVNHDIDDAIRGGILTNDDIPIEYSRIVGNKNSERINKMICAVINASEGKDEIGMEDDVYGAMMGLRAFMFENVYISSEPKIEEKKAKFILEGLYSSYCDNLELVPSHQRELSATDDKDIIVCDYVAGMSDRYAVSKFSDIFVPKFWQF